MLAAIEAAWHHSDPGAPTLAVSVTALAGLGYLVTLSAVQTLLAGAALVAAAGLVLVGLTNLFRAAH